MVSAHHWSDWALEQLLDAKAASGHSVSLVVPARNEATTVGDVVTRVREALVETTDLLDEIEERNPNEYKQWSLAYLHARALIEENEPAKAAEKLAPFLAENHPLRDLALYHQSEVQDAQNQPELASRSRQEVIFRYPKSVYRDVAVEEETEYLSSLSDTKPLLSFAIRLHPTSNPGRRRDLDADGVVVDIGRASEIVRTILAELNYRNLDEVPEFKGRNTTTEFLARILHARIASSIERGDLGPAARAIESVRVTLHESHLASASFDGRVIAG